MTGTWSDKIQQRYHLRIPPDFADWLDREVWNRPGGVEFSHPLPPERILDPEPGAIWGGFMLPDTLPVLGNDYGDWLCLRVTAEGDVWEVIAWWHGGGDWMPYGASLAEAVLFDAAQRVIGSPRTGEHDVPRRYALAEWARDWVRPAIGRFWEPDRSGDPLTELLDAGLCQSAVRRERVGRALHNPLRVHSNPHAAQALAVRWEPEFVHWLFDSAVIPPPRIADLTSYFRLPAPELLAQDWAAAEREALAVTRQRDDLGWAFDVAGWAAERRGKVKQAVEFYQRGVWASAFTDDSVRLRTHWISEGFGKFAAARLNHWRGELSDQTSADPYLQELWRDDPESLRARVRDFWINKARQASRQQRFAEAYDCYYKAGWDCGLQYVTSYAEILDGLIDSAQKADAPALAELGRLHRRSL